MTTGLAKPRPAQLAAALALALALAVAWSAVWRVNQNQQGVVLRFEQVARVAAPGIHFTLPWPVERMVRVATTEVRSMPVGFRLIDQARGIPPTPEQVQWLSGDTNIVELQALVLYTVRDPVAYLFRVSDGIGGDSREFLIRRVTEAVLTERVATMAIDEILAGGKTRLQREAARAAQRELDALGLGVQVSALNIVATNPPAEVISAFNDVSSAKADRARRITEARGYAMEALPRARAQADRLVQGGRIYHAETVQPARGAAASFTKLLHEVRKHPELSRRRLWFEAVGRMLGPTRKIVFEPALDGSAFQLFLEE